jgi:hypothetical protein
LRKFRSQVTKHIKRPIRIGRVGKKLVVTNNSGQRPAVLRTWDTVEIDENAQPKLLSPLHCLNEVWILSWDELEVHTRPRIASRTH